MKRKLLSIILAVIIALSCIPSFTVFAYEEPIVYAISENSYAFGELYSDASIMTLGDDGIYTVTFKDVEPEENIRVDVSEVGGELVEGFSGYNYYPIDVVETCDVTVYFQPKGAYSYDSKIWATGDGVVPRTKPIIDKLFVEGKWCGYSYNDNNKMTQIDDYVYQLKSENLTNSTSYSFRIKNTLPDYTDMWYSNFYSTPAELGVEHEAVQFPFSFWIYTRFNVPYEHSNVTITFDLTDYDYVTKEGAKFKIDATDMRGDINSDGISSIMDATELQKGLVGRFELTENQNIAADVNGDGEVTIDDVTEIQKYLAGYYNSYDDIH